MAEIHPSVNIVEVCKVTPPPTVALPASLSLTFFDILSLRYYPMDALFFYKCSTPFATVVSNLKMSLSSLLQHYLPLAGTIVWPENAPKPAVETLVGDGVQLIVAECSADFNDLVSDGLHEMAKYHGLVPKLPAVESRAMVLMLQVTSFGSQGFCIGLTANHAVMDGRSITSFLKFWSGKCKSLVVDVEFCTTEMMPFYDRSLVIDPKGLEDIYLRDWLAFEGPNSRSLEIMQLTILPNSLRGTFKLNPENIKKLKKFVLNRKDPTHPPARISTFTVVMAYTWVCIAMADNSLDNDEMMFCVTADVRRWLDPPMPENYFGNCIVNRLITLERAKLVGDNGMVTAVEGISEAIKSLERGVLNGAEEWLEIFLTRHLNSNKKIVDINGSPRFELYNMDFGWGMPQKVVLVNGAETVGVCKGGDGGVELGLEGTRGVLETFAAVFAQGLQHLRAKL